MKKRIYLFRIEVKRLHDCKMPEKAKRAFVNCLVPAGNKIEAGKILKNILKEDKFKLIKIDEIIDFKELIFDKKNQHYLKLAKDTLRNNEVYYGTFNYYE